VRIFIVFRDTIYVSGLRSTLLAAPEVEAVDVAPSIALAWEDDALAEADVVVLDSDLGGAESFVREISTQTRARVLVCLYEVRSADIAEAVCNGAGGVLARTLLTPDTLLAAVGAVAAGIFAFDAGVLRVLNSSLAPVPPVPPVSPASERPPAAAPHVGEFAPREQTVLSLVAAGLSNREIAEQLSYSERTIKTILHDIVIKLGVKSRSQAVAMAVRERII
jgi:DNA-binding NarL/FixJ family response regulator